MSVLKEMLYQIPPFLLGAVREAAQNGVDNATFEERVLSIEKSSIGNVRSWSARVNEHSDATKILGFAII